MAYTTTVKKRVLKRVKMGLAPIEHIARLRKIPKQTIYRWLRLYDHFGEVGLENRKPGAKPWQINVTFEKVVVGLWNERNRGVHKIWCALRTMGFDVSDRKSKII